MLHVGKHAVLRVIRETGEAFADYMDKNFRDLPCSRIEMDEQWQYVGAHGSRLLNDETERGDFWLWCCIDADTKLVFSHRVGKRDWWTGNQFVEDVRNRVRLPVQIATDNHRPYAYHIRQHFGYEGYSYGTETKVFGERMLSDGEQCLTRYKMELFRLIPPHLGTLGSKTKLRKRLGKDRVRKFP